VEHQKAAETKVTEARIIFAHFCLHGMNRQMHHPPQEPHVEKKHHNCPAHHNSSVLAKGKHIAHAKEEWPMNHHLSSLSPFPPCRSASAEAQGAIEARASAVHVFEVPKPIGSPFLVRIPCQVRVASGHTHTKDKPMISPQTCMKSLSFALPIISSRQPGASADVHLFTTIGWQDSCLPAPSS
jgi:hypothetical protein